MKATDFHHAWFFVAANHCGVTLDRVQLHQALLNQAVTGRTIGNPGQVHTYVARTTYVQLGAHLAGSCTRDLVGRCR